MRAGIAVEIQVLIAHGYVLKNMSTITRAIGWIGVCNESFKDEQGREDNKLIYHIDRYQGLPHVRSYRSMFPLENLAFRNVFHFWHYKNCHK